MAIEIMGFLGAQAMVQPSAAVYVQMIKACGMVSAFSRGSVGSEWGSQRGSKQGSFDTEHESRNMYSG